MKIPPFEETHAQMIKERPIPHRVRENVWQIMLNHFGKMFPFKLGYTINKINKSKMTDEIHPNIF